MCERELETEQNCNILTPTLLAITAFLFRSPGLLKRGPGDLASLSAGFLYRILSPTHLTSNWLNFLRTELYNSSTFTFFLWASQFRTHSTCPRSRLLYPDIPRPDAPRQVHFLFWQPVQYTTLLMGLMYSIFSSITSYVPTFLSIIKKCFLLVSSS